MNHLIIVSLPPIPQAAPGVPSSGEQGEMPQESFGANFWAPYQLVRSRRTPGGVAFGVWWWASFNSFS